MKFECGDLDRALANPGLIPEAREHLKTCAHCRKEYQLWADISATAQELHQEWQTPDLWPRISQQLQAERKLKPNRNNYWRIGAAAAAALLIAALLVYHQIPTSTNTHLAAAPSHDQDFLTEQALLDVETNEAAYRKSIDQLARLAEPKLKNSSDAAVNAQEKLLMLDAAIADTRGSVASNRFNLHLQTTLADLYRAKQQTLKELLTSDKTN